MNSRPMFKQDLNDSESFSKEVLLPLYYQKNSNFKSTEIVDVNEHYTYNQKISLQKKGVDTFSILQNNKIIAIDEKLQLTTKNTPWFKRSTQALELMFTLSHKTLIGWFLQENLTSHYLFITYFDTFTNNETIINGCLFKNENIKSIEGILISKEIIHKLLEDYNISKDILQNYLQRAVNNNFDNIKYNKGYIYLNNNNIKIVKTNVLKEQPINLVIKLSLYEKYANESFRIFYDFKECNYIKINNFRREQYYGNTKQ